MRGKWKGAMALILCVLLAGCSQPGGFSAGESAGNTDGATMIPVPGKSAYEIALDHGFMGTEEEWLDSLKGGSAHALYAEAFGILPGEVDMDAMNALLVLASEENRTVQFGDGVYCFPSTVEVLSNTSIIGSTNTVFCLSDDSEDTTLMRIGDLADNVFVSHLILQGQLEDMPDTKGVKIGLEVSGALRVNIENVEIAGFDGYGFYAEKMSSNSHGEFFKMLQITNCRFYNNYYGMCLGPRCEYSQVLNCVFGSNQVGCLNQGGNNAYTSCIFNVNGTGFQMDSAGLSNPAHGGCNGCTFNHNTKAIVVNDCRIGWVFDGCQIFYGTLELNNCAGVIIDSTIFGSCKLISSNPGMMNANLITDSFFQTDRNAILAGNDGSVYVSCCIPGLTEEPSDTNGESDWKQITYTQAATVSNAASTDAYFGILSCPVPANTRVDVLEIAIAKATSAGQSVEGVDVWIGNADTGEVLEHIAEDASMTTVYSHNLGKYVLRIEIGRTYEFPVFFVIEASRKAGLGIAYGKTAGNENFFSGSAVSLGDILSINSTYIPEIAVYTIPDDR